MKQYVTIILTERKGTEYAMQMTVLQTVM